MTCQLINAIDVEEFYVILNRKQVSHLIFAHLFITREQTLRFIHMLDLILLHTTITTTKPTGCM